MPCDHKTLKLLQRRLKEKKHNYAVDVKEIKIERGLSVILYLWHSKGFQGDLKDIVSIGERNTCCVAYQIFGYKSWNPGKVKVIAKSELGKIIIESTDRDKDEWTVFFLINFPGAAKGMDKDSTDCVFDFSSTVAANKGGEQIKSFWSGSDFPTNIILRVIVDCV